jgi:putative phosphoesterase
MPHRFVIGLISDTHKLLRPEALGLLRGSDFIIHAGDVGAPEVIAGLSGIAPVTVVRGNIDKGAWAASLPMTDVLAVGSSLIYVLHNIGELDLDPAVAGFAVVVSGHSHRPRIAERNRVLFVNPGSAGPRRFSLPVTVGRLVVENAAVSAELIDLGLDKRQ